MKTNFNEKVAIVFEYTLASIPSVVLLYILLLMVNGFVHDVCHLFNYLLKVVM